MPQHRQQSKRRRFGILGGAAVIGLAIPAALYSTLAANASVPAPTPGYVTTLSTAPRIVSGPGMQLVAGQTVSLEVAGKTFSGITVPADATGVTVSITSMAPSAAGKLTVWTTEAGQPGSPTVTFGAGQQQTNSTYVGLNSAGKLNVQASVATKFVLALQAYVTPVPAPCVPKLYSIPASKKTLTKVGGSIRTGATDFGSVNLPAGTYDTRVVGGWTGLNNGDTWLPDGVFLTGTLVVVKGAEIAADFSNDVTAGGVLIPKADSATLTMDPTAQVTTFLTLAEPTEVHVQLFAYASNSGTAGSGEVDANVQSAQFRSTC